MKTKLILVGFAMCMMALPSMAFADFANLTITDDTSVFVGSGTNYGLETGLYLQVQDSANLASVLVRAETSPYGGSTVTNATFCGYTIEWYGGGLEEILAHHVTNQTWNETEITGLDYPTYNATHQSNMTTQGSSLEWFCFDVTDGVSRDVLASETYTSFILIPMAQSDGVRDTYVRSMEEGEPGSLTAPYLMIEYEPISTTSTTSTSTTSTTTTTTIPPTDFEITDCVAITEPGDYVIMNNITATTPIGEICLNVQSSDVDIDMGGYGIDCLGGYYTAIGMGYDNRTMYANLSAHDGYITGCQQTGIFNVENAYNLIFGYQIAPMQIFDRDFRIENITVITNVAYGFLVNNATGTGANIRFTGDPNFYTFASDTQNIYLCNATANGVEDLGTNNTVTMSACPTEQPPTTEITTSTILDLNNTEYSVCLDNSTLKVVSLQSWFYKGNLTQNYVTNLIYCDFGCDDVSMECKTDPFWVIAFAVVGLIGLVSLLAWVGKRI